MHRQAGGARMLVEEQAGTNLQPARYEKPTKRATSQLGGKVHEWFDEVFIRICRCCYGSARFINARRLCKYCYAYMIHHLLLMTIPFVTMTLAQPHDGSNHVQCPTTLRNLKASRRFERMP
jgi:hypothetical protein